MGKYMWSQFLKDINLPVDGYSEYIDDWFDGLVKAYQYIRDNKDEGYLIPCLSSDYFTEEGLVIVKDFNGVYVCRGEE